MTPVEYRDVYVEGSLPDGTPWVHLRRLSRLHPEVMTKKDAEKAFATIVLPFIQIQEQGRKYRDLPMRREAWANWLDGLVRDGNVTEKQAYEWTLPRCCK